ncbi:MAG TPA: hypothetical protein VE987_08190 [Polyangiaceae bacterium]|nr:hypothetical protein [Polyangiaceae bacterium]
MNAPDIAHALALAREQAARAESRASDAHRVATVAVDHALETQQQIGALAREVAEGRAESRAGLAALEKLMRAGFAQLGAVAKEAKREARKSGHDLAAWREDSTVTHLREELARARTQLAMRQARAAKWFWWAMGIVAAVVVALVLTVLGLHK